jgi:hypothetical protein
MTGTAIRFHPERLFSNEGQHFKAAYHRRPELIGVVVSLFVAILVLALDGAFNIVTGEILRGLGLLFLGAVTFALWAALHNWALTHPRE